MGTDLPTAPVPPQGHLHTAFVRPRGVRGYKGASGEAEAFPLPQAPRRLPSPCTSLLVSVSIPSKPQVKPPHRWQPCWQGCSCPSPSGGSSSRHQLSHSLKSLVATKTNTASSRICTSTQVPLGCTKSSTEWRPIRAVSPLKQRDTRGRTAWFPPTPAGTRCSEHGKAQNMSTQLSEGTCSSHVVAIHSSAWLTATQHHAPNRDFIDLIHPMFSSDVPLSVSLKDCLTHKITVQTPISFPLGWIYKNINVRTRLPGF